MTPIDIYAVAVVAAITVGALRSWALWRRTARAGRFVELPARPGPARSTRGRRTESNKGRQHAA